MRRPYPTGGHLAQRGFRRELNQVIDAHFPALEEAIGVTAVSRVIQSCPALPSDLG